MVPGTFFDTADKQWDTFRKCMAQQCECMNCQSESPPPNARCYKETFFDEAFAACDFNIDSKKQAPFKSYFWDEFLIAEQQKSCDYHEGEYDPETRECTVAVSYRYLTAGIKTTGGGCGQSRTLMVKLGGRPLACTRERFALPDCNVVNEDIENQRKQQQMMGWVSLGTGVLGGVVGGLSAGLGKGKQASEFSDDALASKVECTDCRGDDEKYIVINKKGEKEKLTRTEINKYKQQNEEAAVDSKDKTGKVISNVWDASNQGLIQGTTSFISANILDSTGRLVTGKCTTADGIEVLEPNTIFLDW